MADQLPVLSFTGHNTRHVYGLALHEYVTTLDAMRGLYSIAFYAVHKR